MVSWVLVAIGVTLLRVAVRLGWRATRSTFALRVASPRCSRHCLAWVRATDVLDVRKPKTLPQTLTSNFVPNGTDSCVVPEVCLCAQGIGIAIARTRNSAADFVRK